MSDLIDTTEMYLKTIYEMEEDGVPPLRARIVERLGHSGPTVSQTVARMERDGLLVVAGDRRIQLTDRGREVAREVMLKHRVAERLLLDVIGMPWELVHDEACRWEHVMSEQVEDRLAQILDDVSTDPFGNRIPGRSADRPAPGPHEISAERLVRQGGGEAVVSRVGEPIQAVHGLLADLEEAGVRSGSSVTLRQAAGGVRIIGPDGDPLVLPSDVARHLFVVR